MSPSERSGPDPLLTARLRQLIGDDSADRLWETQAVLLGVGGVGSWCAEALIRSGIGHLEMIDPDTVSLSNINRQLPATLDTVGALKIEVMVDRLRRISDRATIVGHPLFWKGNETLDLSRFDVVIDCIDTLPSKVALARTAVESGCRFYSSMGAGRRLDPTRIRVDSIWKTKGCPIAREIRYRLRKEGVTGDYLAVFSDEPPAGEELPPPSFPPSAAGEGEARKRQPGSAVHVTASFGMALAGLVIAGR